jgi:hypothetical protein
MLSNSLVTDNLAISRDIFWGTGSIVKQAKIKFELFKRSYHTVPFKELKFVLTRKFVVNLANNNSTLCITYLLTPWSRVLLEKPTVNFAASQEIPRIYGTRKFLIIPTSARHLSLSWANSIQSPRPPPTFWRSILILSTIYVLVSLMASFPQASPPTPCTHLYPPPYARHALPISFVSILPPAQYWVRSTDHSAPRYARCVLPSQEGFGRHQSLFCVHCSTKPLWVELWGFVF